MPMTCTERIVNSILRFLIRLVCRVDQEELNKIPLEGPGILATNHTTNLEGPIYYVLLDPRRKTAFGKIELWNNPLTRFLMQVWHVVPLKRGAADRQAMRRALRMLDQGQFLGIAPEGTRSRTGTLNKGLPGMAMLAVARRVQIFPMVHWGIHEIPRNLARVRKTHLHFRVGAPFYLKVSEERSVTARDLRAMTDEIMFRLAALLPEPMRGYYHDLTKMTNDYIEPVMEG